MKESPTSSTEPLEPHRATTIHPHSGKHHQNKSFDTAHSERTFRINGARRHPFTTLRPHHRRCGAVRGTPWWDSGRCLERVRVEVWRGGSERILEGTRRCWLQRKAPCWSLVSGHFWSGLHSMEKKLSVEGSVLYQRVCESKKEMMEMSLSCGYRHLKGIAECKGLLYLELHAKVILHPSS